MTIPRERSDAAENRARGIPEIPKGSQVLIAGDDPSAEQLEAALIGIGIASKTAKSMTEACECVRSGRFQAVFSKPLLHDGSWRRLIEIANHYDLGFEVVLVAHDWNLAAWTEALNEGAFDVLDSMDEKTRVTEVTKRALWAAYLRGAGPRSKMAGPQRAA